MKQEYADYGKWVKKVLDAKKAARPKRKELLKEYESLAEKYGVADASEEELLSGCGFVHIGSKFMLGGFSYFCLLLCGICEVDPKIAQEIGKLSLAEALDYYGVFAPLEEVELAAQNLRSVLDCPLFKADEKDAPPALMHISLNPTAAGFISGDYEAKSDIMDICYFEDVTDEYHREFDEPMKKLRSQIRLDAAEIVPALYVIGPMDGRKNREFLCQALFGYADGILFVDGDAFSILSYEEKRAVTDQLVTASIFFEAEIAFVFSSDDAALIRDCVGYAMLHTGRVFLLGCDYEPNGFEFFEVFRV